MLWHNGFDCLIITLKFGKYKKHLHSKPMHNYKMKTYDKNSSNSSVYTRRHNITCTHVLMFTIHTNYTEAVNINAGSWELCNLRRVFREELPMFFFFSVEETSEDRMHCILLQFEMWKLIYRIPQVYLEGEKKFFEI